MQGQNIRVPFTFSFSGYAKPRKKLQTNGDKLWLRS